MYNKRRPTTRSKRAPGGKNQRNGSKRGFNVPQKSISMVEWKNIDFNTVGQIVVGQATASVVQLNIGCVTGTGPTQHIGRLIRMRHLSLTLAGSLLSTTTGGTPLRYLVIYDRQTNAALPATTTIMAVDSIQSPLNLANSHRFQILRDIWVENVSAGGALGWHHNCELPLDHIVEYNTTNGGTIADITTGAMYLLVYSSGTLAVASPTDYEYSRIRYSDA